MRIHNAYRNKYLKSCEKMRLVVPQAFILGSLLLNIPICGLFSAINNVNVASYADVNTPYVIEDGIAQVDEFLKEASYKLFCWFAFNQMKANPDKWHLITGSSYDVSICAKNAA